MAQQPEEILRNQGEAIQQLRDDLAQVRQQNIFLEGQAREMLEAKARIEVQKEMLSTGPIVDSKLISRPEVFHGGKEKWKDWCFLTKAWMCALNPKYQEMFEKMDKMSSDVQSSIERLMGKLQRKGLISGDHDDAQAADSKDPKEASMQGFVFEGGR